MAISAGSAKVTAVHIVPFMTAGAFRRRLSVRSAIVVATAATLRFVGAAQREFGQVVIEQARLQADDVCLATLVLSVAGAALSALCLRMASMKSPLFAEIYGDVFVAIQAEPLLRPSIKKIVAGAAGILGVCMRLGHRSGHDQTLQAGTAGRCCRQQQDADNRENYERDLNTHVRPPRE